MAHVNMHMNYSCYVLRSSNGPCKHAHELLLLCFCVHLMAHVNMHMNYSCYVLRSSNGPCKHAHEL